MRKKVLTEFQINAKNRLVVAISVSLTLTKEEVMATAKKPVKKAAAAKKPAAKKTAAKKK